MKLLDDITESELLKIEKEFDVIKQKTFWKKYKEAILEERNQAIGHCVTDREDIRLYQGKVKMADIILAMPKRIIDELRHKSG